HGCRGARQAGGARGAAPIDGEIGCGRTQALPEGARPSDQDVDALVATELLDPRLGAHSGEHPHFGAARCRHHVNGPRGTLTAHLGSSLRRRPWIVRAALREGFVELYGRFEARLAVGPRV